MNTLLDQKLPGDVLSGIAQRMVARRKALGLTQAALATKSGVSLASVKRFERLHRISLESLVNIAFALRAEDDFDGLFAERVYGSIDDVVRASRGKRSRTARG